MTLFDRDLKPDPALLEQRRTEDVAARDAALASVESNAPPDWNDDALAFIRAYLEANETLFVDDLWAAGLPKPPNPKALGPVLIRAARAGWMEKTGEYRPSSSSHQSVKPVWRSLLHDGASTAGRNPTP